MAGLPHPSYQTILSSELTTSGFLYSGSSIDYTPKYFVALHNKLVILLQRALKYIKRGIDVPLSDNVKELLGYAFHNHNDNVVPPSKHICHDYACGI